MNGKLAKMYRKEARKEAAKEMQLLNRVLKPKPRFFPLFAWRILAKLFFNIPII